MEAKQDLLRREAAWREKEDRNLQLAANFLMCPGEHDVLLGRKRKGYVLTWPGNVSFLELIKEFAMEYQIATLKKEKLAIVQKIAHIIQVERGGRFLNRNDKGWEVVTEKDGEVIHQKINQALRDEGRRINKSLK